jgi:hypothetical protein
MLPLTVTMIVGVRPAVSNGPRPARQKEMTVKFAARMAVDVMSVPMQNASTRAAHRQTT